MSEMAGGAAARNARNVHVMYLAERDPGRWEARHDAGEVPGRWPYGLDALAEGGLDVVAEGIAGTGRGRAVLRQVLPSSLGPLLGRRTVENGIGLAWDENAAARMVESRPCSRMFSGVIWLTDDRGSADPGMLGRMRRVLRRMDGLWVNSSAQIEPLYDYLGPYPPPVEFFRFGVDEEFYRMRPYPHSPLVVSVGGDRDRDHVTLYDALARVHAARPDVEIVVQSSSSVEPPPGVTRVGHLTHLQVRDLYARASVVAIATRPNLHLSGLTVSLESMATGRPVVITGTPGMDDYLRDGENGMLVRTRDSVGLCDAVVDLLDDPARAARIGARGRAGVEEQLTSRHLTRDLAGFITRHSV